MAILISGMLLWMGVHLMPALLPSNKKALVAKLGRGRYMLLFTILIFTALFLIIVGWQKTSPEFVYHLSFGRHITMLLMVVALLYFSAAKILSRIKNTVNHPQLTSVLIWACAHLIANGDTRSIILFGGMAFWSALEILLINKRDGKIEKTAVTGWKGDIGVVVMTAILVGLLLVVHPYISGVPIVRQVL
ncbi:MAG: NnrU family protein [Pseudomonadales bacterium]|nr:NnrU family protein [Pseudomonadales bacterium]